MTDYILDATVVMNYLINDKHTKHATALFTSINKTQDQFIVPEFAMLECTNVLWKQVRFFGMSIATSESLTDALYNLPLKSISVAKFMKSALQIGIRNELAIYDSIYIALALHYQIPLITVDQKQGKVASVEGVILKPLTDFSLSS